MPPKMQGSLEMKGSLMGQSPLSGELGAVGSACLQRGLETASGLASMVRDVGVRLHELCLAFELEALA